MLCYRYKIYKYHYERRRIKDLRGEVVTEVCTLGRIGKSRMKWAGPMVRMKDERLPKRSETKKQEGCRKRVWTAANMGGLCEERYRKAEEEAKWTERSNN